MIKAIAHRGPDGEDILLADDYAFGHRRLAIIDRSDRAAQPMRTADGTGALVYNGEVYNFRVLRGELEEAGIKFRSNGDSEVVLQALHHWGPEEAIKRFNGMFALAYHDRRQDTLWLARDRLGIKPLSFARRDDRFVFASEDKGILAIGDLTPSIDPLALAYRFVRLSEPNGSSVFAGIDRVRPGTIMKLSGETVEEIRYWSPYSAFDAARAAQDKRGLREKQTMLHGLIKASVEMHLAADTPLATCLSGGVDSGLITAIAGRHVGNLRSYVADPDSGPNEVEAASLTARHVGVDLKKVTLDRQTFLRQWSTTLWAMETPSEFISDPALLAIAQQSYRDGIPVLLTGEGSDELFGGYDTHTIAAARWRSADPPYSWFRNRKAAAALRFQLAAAPAFSSLIQAGTMARSSGLAAAAPYQAVNQLGMSAAAFGLSTHVERGLIAAKLHDLNYHLQALLNRHDRLAMAACVEMRVPFLENAVIDFGLHLPPRDLQRRGTSKFLLKRVARSYIPRVNINKRKLGFPVTLDYTRGTESLLERGVLQHVMRWRANDVRAAVALARTEGNVRHLLVGSEVLARIYMDRQSPEALGETLIAASSEHANAG